MFLKLNCLLSGNIEIANSCMKITLLSSLFKYFNMQRVINKNTMKLYAVFFTYIRNDPISFGKQL
jgi:hypothetical protein